MQIDWFFKVEPPLTLHRLDASRDPRGFVRPVHSDLCCELLGNVMTTGAFGSHISFLQRKHINTRQQLSVCECARCDRDLLSDVLRSPSQTHQSHFATK